MSTSQDGLRLGILGTGGIVRLAVPQMKQSASVQINAIASRIQEKAEAIAGELGIPKAHGSYEALIADPDIEAIYIALPITMHTEWTLKALAAGKHVLCEKPLAPSSAEARRITEEATARNLVVWEGFMVRHHPQWRAVSQIIADGRIGTVRAVQGMLTRTPPNAFDPSAIANRADLGGGVLLDGGCYMVHLSRLAFGSEPQRVAAVADVEPAVGVATYFSGMMQFDTGVASFTLSSRLRRFQRFLIVGTEGSLDVRVPVMPHPTRATQVIADYRDTPLTDDPEVLEFGPVPSFRAQIDNFADTIRNGTPAPFDGQSSIANAVVLEALDHSAQQNGTWVALQLGLDASIMA
jgi:predicted dehydrogenase